MLSYQAPRFDYVKSPDETALVPARHQVVIIGAGPVGMTAAIDLALRGIRVLVLEDDETVSESSRAICHSRRTLEIWDRLGAADIMMKKGLTWATGRVFFQDAELFTFDLATDDRVKYPPFINLQQYYVEDYLIQRAMELPNIELRWRNTVVGVDPGDTTVDLHVKTPSGRYAITADWVLAIDGARSPLRSMIGLSCVGYRFADSFLNTVVRIHADIARERWFWFDPSFAPNGTALLHQLPDGLYRIDIGLQPDANVEAEQDPTRVRQRLSEMLGDVEFDVEWMSTYVVRCERLDQFRHGRIIFAGDSAHQVSPYGARGGNSGIQDVDNLCWKLTAVIEGHAPEKLLDTYDEERVAAAQENIEIAAGTVNFIAPPDEEARKRRDATLRLAVTSKEARADVDSGRLSTPSTYLTSSLNTPDTDIVDPVLRPGTPAIDAPVEGPGYQWLLEKARGSFYGLYFTDGKLSADVAKDLMDLQHANPAINILVVSPRELSSPLDLEVAVDASGEAAHRYLAQPGTFYLLRPDQHVCARWRHFSPDHVRDAQRRALALPYPEDTE